jgi:hypothetical protein
VFFVGTIMTQQTPNSLFIINGVIADVLGRIPQHYDHVKSLASADAAGAEQFNASAFSADIKSTMRKLLWGDGKTPGYISRIGLGENAKEARLMTARCHKELLMQADPNNPGHLVVLAVLEDFMTAFTVHIPRPSNTTEANRSETGSPSDTVIPS